MFKYIFVIMLLLFLQLTFSSLEQKSAGPPGCFAGEPPNFTTCRSCHTGAALNSGTATVTLDLGTAQLGYYPDSVYNFIISVQRTGMEAAGFQFIALQDNDNTTSPGTITLTDPQRMGLITPANPHAQGCSPANRVWVEHNSTGIISNASGLSQWSFQWKAPSSNVGIISFYLATLESNYDLEETGDYVYTRHISSPCLLSNTEEQENLNNQVFIYPNPSSIELVVETIEDIEWEQIQLINLQGQVIQDFWVEYPILGSSKQILNVATIPRGLYFLSLKANGKQVVKKVVLL